MNSNTPDSIPPKDWPDATVENVPDDVLAFLAEKSTTYRACPDCGEGQFFPMIDTHSVSWQCSECGAGVTVVG